MKRPSRSSARDRKSTRLNSSHTVIYTLSLHDALPISIEDSYDRLMNPSIQTEVRLELKDRSDEEAIKVFRERSEEHTSELQSHSDLHSFPTRRSSDLHRRLLRPPDESVHPDRGPAGVEGPLG